MAIDDDVIEADFPRDVNKKIRPEKSPEFESALRRILESPTGAWGPHSNDSNV